MCDPGTSRERQLKLVKGCKCRIEEEEELILFIYPAFLIHPHTSYRAIQCFSSRSTGFLQHAADKITASSCGTTHSILNAGTRLEDAVLHFITMATRVSLRSDLQLRYPSAPEWKQSHGCVKYICRATLVQWRLK